MPKKVGDKLLCLEKTVLLKVQTKIIFLNFLHFSYTWKIVKSNVSKHFDTPITIVNIEVIDVNVKVIINMDCIPVYMKDVIVLILSE